MDSTLLLCIAALLIFNSHLEPYYPHRWMAGDGLLGNTMFFVLSGYGVQSSLNRKTPTFGQYMWRRFLRIYPAFYLTILSLGLPGVLLAVRNDASKLPEMLLWPTSYTYIRMIIPLYVLLYFVGRTHSRDWWLACATLTSAVSYLVLAITDARTIPAGSKLILGLRPVPVHATYYATSIFAGAVLSVRNLKPVLSLLRVATLFALLASYFTAKLEMVARDQFASLYPLLHVLALSACVNAVLTFGGAESIDMLPNFARALARRGAVLTLELYLTHEAIIEWPIFRPIPFPLNILALLLATIVASEIVHRFAAVIRKAIERIVVPRRRMNA